MNGGATNQDLTADYFDEEVLFSCTDLNGNVYTLSNVGTNAPMIAVTFYRATGAFGNPQNILLTKLQLFRANALSEKYRAESLVCGNQR